MKKLLLSAIALFGLAAAANAADVKLNVNDATAIDGTLVEEKAPEGESNGQAKHYQPLKSFTLGGYSFSFTKGDASSDPAYYYSMSTAATQKCSVRLYKAGKGKTTGNTMTIKAPAGASFAKITFTGTNKGTVGDAITASVGSAKIASATVMEWTNTEAVSEVTLTIQASPFYINEVTFSSEGGSVDPTPDPTPDPEETTYTKVTSLESGKYAIAVMQDGAAKLVRPYIGTNTYGRWNVTDANLNGNTLTTTADNEFTITVADGKATIQDNTGRFYGMDDSHFTSFQFYNEVNNGCYYTFAFEGDNVKFTNTLNTDCFICQSKGNQGTWYTNVAPAKAPTEFNLPILFKSGNSAIEAVEAENNDAPVVYFNLQGQRVENPANGLFIRVQGNKATKVAIR